MSKTARQKSRRMQNRLMAERRYYSGELNSHTLKGVGVKQAIDITSKAYAYMFDNHRNDCETIESRGHGAYNAYQKSYKHKGIGKHKTHIHTPSNFLYHLRESRKMYRKLEKGWKLVGGNPEDFDKKFKKEHPREHRIILENKDELKS